MITIDELRKLSDRPYYNALGVIKIKFRGGLAYHFYSDLSPPVVKDFVHSHQYSFSSTVKKGTLKNYVYDFEAVDDPTNYKMIKQACCEGSIPTTLHENIDLTEVLNYTTTVKESYRINYRLLHKIELVTPKVITYLHSHSPVIQTQPQFIIDKRKPDYDAFAHRRSVSRCWEIIEHTLND